MVSSGLSVAPKNRKEETPQTPRCNILCFFWHLFGFCALLRGLPARGEGASRDSRLLPGFCWNGLCSPVSAKPLYLSDLCSVEDSCQCISRLRWLVIFSKRCAGRLEPQQAMPLIFMAEGSPISSDVELGEGATQSFISRELWQRHLGAGLLETYCTAHGIESTFNKAMHCSLPSLPSFFSSKNQLSKEP